jgi:hypothetical protein
MRAASTTAWAAAVESRHAVAAAGTVAGEGAGVMFSETVASGVDDAVAVT